MFRQIYARTSNKKRWSNQTNIPRALDEAVSKCFNYLKNRKT